MIRNGKATFPPGTRAERTKLDDGKTMVDIAWKIEYDLDEPDEPEE